jgi:DNA-binding FadR family transcriptional regulator
MNAKKIQASPGVADFDQTILVPGPLPVANVFEETVERLGRTIKLGLLAPGQRLPPERELAQIMGISRTTVRAAIRVLVQGRFLVSRRGRGGGTFVAIDPPGWRSDGANSAGVWDETRAQFFLDKRLVIESGIVELAAARADATTVRSLRAMVGEMAELLDDFDAYRARDVRFHVAIAQITANPDLIQLATGIQDKLGELLTKLPASKEALAHSNQQHAQIVAAISKADSDAARQAMKTHLEGTEHLLAGLLPANLKYGDK